MYSWYCYKDSVIKILWQLGREHDTSEWDYTGIQHVQACLKFAEMIVYCLPLRLQFDCGLRAINIESERIAHNDKMIDAPQIVRVFLDVRVTLYNMIDHRY